MKLFDGIFSIDEFKISSLVLIMIAVIVVILVVYITTGNVDHVLVSFAETLVYSVAGVNAVNGFTSVMDKRKKFSNNQETSSDTQDSMKSSEGNTTYKKTNEEDEMGSVEPKI